MLFVLKLWFNKAASFNIKRDNNYKTQKANYSIEEIVNLVST